MYTKWTSHIKDPEEKADFLDYVKHSRRLLDKIKSVIEDDLKGLESAELSVRQFEIPNWAHRQAFYNGARSAYSAILRLVDLDQQKDVNEPSRQSNGSRRGTDTRTSDRPQQEVL